MAPGALSRILAACVMLAVAAPALVAQVADVTVQGAPASMQVGRRAEVLAAAYDRSGNIVDTKFTWDVSDRTLLKVEDAPGVAGLVYITGLAIGTAHVTVKAGGHSADFTLEVTSGIPGVVAGTGQAVVVELPQKVFLYPGEEAQLVPRFLRADGQPAAPVAITWTSLRPEIATVGQNGKVIGISNGPGLIQASAPGLPVRSVQVAVGTQPWAFSKPFVSLPPTESDTVGVIVPSQSDRPLEPRQLSWRSENPNVAVVTPLGVVTGISAGQTQLVATGFGQEQRLAVSVHRPVAELRVRARAGDTIPIPLGGRQAFHAVPYASDGTPVPEAPVVWKSGDTSIVQYSIADSAAFGKAIGTTMLSVVGPGVTKTWTIQVVAAGLVVAPHRLGISRGQRETLLASFADETGAPLSPATQLRWTSTDPAVARVDESGTVEGLATGRAIVVASTPWGNADSIPVFVQGEILVVSTRAGAADIYSLDRATYTQLNPVIQSPARDYSPAYSTDGTHIAFISDRGGNPDVYVADADGGNVHAVTNTPGIEDSPAWTPDGGRIVYAANTDGTMQVWIMNADGTEPQQLTAGPGLNQSPVVSPDGSTIAFASTRDGNYEVYLMKLDGGDQRNATNSPANEMSPQWIGDSTLTYIREQRAGGTLNRTVMGQPLAGGSPRPLSPAVFIVRDFAISSSGDLVAAVTESFGSSGTSVFQLFLLPVSGGAPTEVPRQGDRDRFVTPAFRP